MQSKAKAHRRSKGNSGGSEVPDFSRLDLLEAQLNTEAMAEEWWEKKHPGIPRYKSPQIARIRAEVARIKRQQRAAEVRTQE